MNINYIKTQGSDSNISIIFNRGSVNELKEEYGYTHLLEHCLLEMFRLEKDCTLQAYTEFDHVEFDFLIFQNSGDLISWALSGLYRSKDRFFFRIVEILSSGFFGASLI